MTAPDPPPRDLPDRVLRELLAHPDHLRSVLRRAVPAVADGFDYARLKVLDRAFLLDDWRSREGDLLFELPYRAAGGDLEALVLVLLEHQSAPDPRMPLRTLVYAVLWWERQWKAWEESPHPRPPLVLTPVVPVVLHTGGRPWATNTALADLFDAPAEVLAWVPDWRPVFWDLAAQSADDLLASREAVMQFLAVAREEGAATGRFEEVLRQALRGLELLHDPERVRWYDLVRAVMAWALWRRPRDEQGRWVDVAVAVHGEEARKREVADVAQTIAEGLIEEGMRKGEAVGEAKGVRATILRQGRKRFGPPSDAAEAALAAITDPGRLAELSERLLDVNSWAELLADPAP